MENNIDNYKTRFFNLLESTMGDVKPLLNEDDNVKIVNNFDKKFDYKKEGNNFFYKSKTSNDWIQARGNGLEAIKTKVFNLPPSTQNKVAPVKDKEESWHGLLGMGGGYNNKVQTKKQIETNPLPKKNDGKPDNNGTNSVLNINIPLHQYAALRFLKFSKTTLTESEINQQTLNDISNILCEKSARMKTCNPSQWKGKDPRGGFNKNRLSYNDYTTLYSKSPSYGKKSFTFEEQPNSIKGPMLTFGQATITGGDGGWVITDKYNFDNIQETKPYLKSDSYLTMAKNVVTGLFRAIKSTLKSESPIDGIEEAMSQLHNLGYNGYEVKVKIPSNGCKCKY